MYSKPGKFVGLSFSFKLGVWYSLFFTVCVMALFAFSFHLLESALYQKDVEVLDLQASKYTESYNKGELQFLKKKFNEERSSSRNVFFLRVLSEKNEPILVRQPPKSVLPTPDEFAQVSPHHSGIWSSENKKHVWTVKEVKLLDGNMLQVGKNSQESIAFLSSLRIIFIKTAVPVLLLGVFVGISLTYRAIKPIRNIVTAVDKLIRTGEIKTRVSVDHITGKGQLNELVVIINKMLARNQETFDAMRNSLDNVAHDLRTPMTRLRGSAEAALISDDHDSIHDSLADCLEESDNVLQMLNSMMDLAEIESGAMKLKISTFKISAILDQVIDLYEIIAEDSNMTINTDIHDNLEIKGDRIRLKQVFANLIDNAIKYSPDNSIINVVVRQKGKAIVVSVQDQGLGIEGQDKVLIFNRLYRADASRSKHGIGLGLSLVKGIVEAHNGRITVESFGTDKGSTFKVALPINREDTDDS